MGRAKRHKARAANRPKTGNRHFIDASKEIFLVTERRKLLSPTFLRMVTNQRPLIR
jgi:hypothetical protein